jgi:hypothetical protein
MWQIRHAFTVPKDDGLMKGYIRGEIDEALAARRAFKTDDPARRHFAARQFRAEVAFRILVR